MNTQEGTANAPRITEVSASSHPRSIAGMGGSTQSGEMVCDSEEAAQFPKNQLDCAVFGSWVDRLSDAHRRIKDTLDNETMPFGIAVAVWQQLERQYDLINKMRKVLDARKAELDAMDEGELADVRA
jgi:hypothetical protein